MNRLTFKEKDGTFGVIGMNSSNEEAKLYGCVLKLLHYEETGLSPEEVDEIKEYMKENEIKNITTLKCFINYIRFNPFAIAVYELGKIKDFVGRQLMITTTESNSLDNAEAKGCNELRSDILKTINERILDLEKTLKVEC